MGHALHYKYSFSRHHPLAQTSGDTNTYDRNQAQLESIRGDPTTYSSIPEGSSVVYYNINNISVVVS